MSTDYMTGEHVFSNSLIEHWSPIMDPKDEFFFFSEKKHRYLVVLSR